MDRPLQVPDRRERYPLSKVTRPHCRWSFHPRHEVRKLHARTRSLGQTGNKVHKCARRDARHECGRKICRQKGIEFARGWGTRTAITQRYMHLEDWELADAHDLVGRWKGTWGGTG